MKVLLLLISLPVLTSCANLAAPVAAVQMAGSANHTDLPRPEFEYKKGDKITLYSRYAKPKECEVVNATSNPYSTTPMLALYDIKCPGDYDSFKFDSNKIAHNKQLKEIWEKQHPNGYKEPSYGYKPDFKVGEKVSYYDHIDDTVSKCEIIKIEDVGLGKSQIDYVMSCEGHDNTVTTNANGIRAGRKIAADRASGKGMTAEESFKLTVKKTLEQRKQTLKNLAK